MYMWSCVYVYVYVHVHVYVYVNVYVYVSVNVYIHVYMCICVYVYVYVYLCVCVCVCMCVCVYINRSAPAYTPAQKYTGHNSGRSYIYRVQPKEAQEYVFFPLFFLARLPALPPSSLRQRVWGV